MKIIFGLFLIAHGLVHSMYFIPSPPQTSGGAAWPFDLTRSWVFTPLGLNTETIKIIGIVLTVAAILGFIFSGIGWLGFPGLKLIAVPVTVISAVTSFILIGLFWNNSFIFAQFLNLGILAVVFFKLLKP